MNLHFGDGFAIEVYKPSWKNNLERLMLKKLYDFIFRKNEGKLNIIQFFNPKEMERLNTTDDGKKEFLNLLAILSYLHLNRIIKIDGLHPILQQKTLTQEVELWTNSKENPLFKKIDINTKSLYLGILFPKELYIKYQSPLLPLTKVSFQDDEGNPISSLFINYDSINRWAIKLLYFRHITLVDWYHVIENWLMSKEKLWSSLRYIIAAICSIVGIIYFIYRIYSIIHPT